MRVLRGANCKVIFADFAALAAASGQTTVSCNDAESVDAARARRPSSPLRACRRWPRGAGDAGHVAAHEPRTPRWRAIPGGRAGRSVPAGGAAGVELEAPFLGQRIADDAVARCARRRRRPIAQHQVAEVDARAGSPTPARVVAPVALARQRRARARPEAGRDDLQCPQQRQQQVAHRQQLARRLAQRGLDEDTVPPGASSPSAQARTRARPRHRCARPAAVDDRARPAGGRRRSGRSARSTGGSSAARFAITTPGAATTDRRRRRRGSAPKRARSAAPAAPVPAPEIQRPPRHGGVRREHLRQDLAPAPPACAARCRARTRAAARRSARYARPDQRALAHQPVVNADPPTVPRCRRRVAPRR